MTESAPTTVSAVLSFRFSGLMWSLWTRLASMYSGSFAF